MTQTGHDGLYDELIRVHKELVHRENVSSITIGTCAKVGKDYFSSLAAGLLTLGNKHAPIIQTYELLQRQEGAPKLANFFLGIDKMVSGWGSSFIKGEKDPIFDSLDEMLSKFRVHETIWSITNTLHDSEAMLWPNAACYTAAVALTLNLPKEVSPYLVVQGRLDGWTEIYYQNYTDNLKEPLDEQQREEVS